MADTLDCNLPLICEIMPVIQIREQSCTTVERGEAIKIVCKLVIIDTREVDYGLVTISPPFVTEPQKDRDLTWYFEEWLRMPLVERVRAQRAAESVKEYGESLFEQVFSDDDARSAYHQLRKNLDCLEIEIIGTSPAFQAFHWEAMRDPKLSCPFAVKCTVLRKYTYWTASPAEARVSPILNVLLVTARPDEENDVGYRTISRPMVELIRTANLHVNIDILRPATYETLIKHLGKRGAGYYHILHFDGHGALLTYDEYLVGMNRDRHFFQRSYGLSDLDQYEGSKAFLFFEGQEKGQATPVEAKELADLLKGEQIPICILNACQSAMQLDDARETSLGGQLMVAGMQAVLAMGYSVTVTAAVVLMKNLYEELFGNQNFYKAVQSGRYELYNNKERRGYFNSKIDLEDWLLPVVYGSGDVKLNLRKPTPDEEGEMRSRYQFKLPNYGFFGRDLEILKIEKGLLRRNVMLLQGMGGSGKTTLLNYLQEWWRITNFALEVFYFGYDFKAWTLSQILAEISCRIYDKNEHANFIKMNPQARIQKITKKLRATEYVLMLDNLESVTAQPLPILKTLNPKKQEELREFLTLLVGGKTKVLLGSRGNEEWLRDLFQFNIYNLQGLDIEARTTLAQEILKRHVAPEKIDRIQSEPNFEQVMKILAGYPLAMEVVLANLRQKEPQHILSALKSSDLDLDVDNDDERSDRTRSMVKCVEYSYSNLSKSAQDLLRCLAPFSGFIWREGIRTSYAKQLQQLTPFQNFKFDEFDSAIQEAINWGLLSPVLINSDGFTSDLLSNLLAIQPVLPYFLQSQLNQSKDLIKEREALQEGFKNYYRDLTDSYKVLINSEEMADKKFGIFICQLEYENLYAALQVCLNKQESIKIYFCLNEYFIFINDFQSGLKIAEEVNQALSQYSSDLLTGELAEDAITARDCLGNAYIATQKYEFAKEIHQNNLNAIDALDSMNTRKKESHKAASYHNLGIATLLLKKLEEARQHFQQALAINVELDDRHNQAQNYHQLGMLAQDLKEWEEARQHYNKALEIDLELGSRHALARTFHQLGSLAQNLQIWDEAHENYHKARDLFVEFNDVQNEAHTYRNLGIVATKLHEWERSRCYFHKALKIYVEIRDRYSQACIYQLLALMEEELKQWEEARQNLYQALDIHSELNDQNSKALTYKNLGAMEKELRQWEQAHQNYNKALEIYVELGDCYSQAYIYYGLGVLAEEEGNLEDAVEKLLQALEIFTAIKDEILVKASIVTLNLPQDISRFGDFRIGEVNIYDATRYVLDSIAMKIVALALKKFDESQDQQVSITALRTLARIHSSNQSKMIAFLTSALMTSLNESSPRDTIFAFSFFNRFGLSHLENESMNTLLLFAIYFDRVLFPSEPTEN